jgi:sec-independent protein translocase protein TatA
MFGLGDWEVLLLGLLALLLFGKDLPNIMRKVGTSFYQFKRHIDETKNEIRKSIEDIPKKD